MNSKRAISFRTEMHLLRLTVKNRIILIIMRKSRKMTITKALSDLSRIVIVPPMTNNFTFDHINDIFGDVCGMIGNPLQLA